jgi:membrane protein
LIFGWYVTRFANYSEVYGSLGAGIALLFWLYIVSLSVLCGGEFNAQFESECQARFSKDDADLLRASKEQNGGMRGEPLAVDSESEKSSA